MRTSSSPTPWPGGHDTIVNHPAGGQGEPTVESPIAMARFDGDYHGTGCTLATAIACGLAQGRSVRQAVDEGQRFVHRAVANAWRPGSRQHIPRRTPSLLRS
jgi:hydroxymethylpyrimidine/phosphomethylpyrimidine kinase